MKELITLLVGILIIIVPFLLLFWSQVRQQKKIDQAIEELALECGKKCFFPKCSGRCTCNKNHRGRCKFDCGKHDPWGRLWSEVIALVIILAIFLPKFSNAQSVHLTGGGYQYWAKGIQGNYLYLGPSIVFNKLGISTTLQVAPESGAWGPNVSIGYCTGHVPFGISASKDIGRVPSPWSGGPWIGIDIAIGKGTLTPALQIAWSPAIRGTIVVLGTSASIPF